MRRALRLAVPVVLSLVVPITAAPAQQRLQPHVGVGALLPMGDLGDYGKTGYLLFAGADLPLPANPRVTIGATLFYGHTEHEGGLNEATNIPGITADVGYALVAAGSIIPYVRGSIGFLQHRYDAGDTGFDDESESSLAFGGGGGLALPRGSLVFFGGAHYLVADGTDFVNAYFGLSFGGNNGQAGLRRR
ncbi:MAG TPA: outer membrane beta-barrel protein [Gemmatimonadaceae bacterium]|nr:outer membrane beta-barrel protein [Gemmatimonadaceae bacterium]